MTGQSHRQRTLSSMPTGGSPGDHSSGRHVWLLLALAVLYAAICIQGVMQRREGFFFVYQMAPVTSLMPLGGSGIVIQTIRPGGDGVGVLGIVPDKESLQHSMEESLQVAIRDHFTGGILFEKAFPVSDIADVFGGLSIHLPPMDFVPGRDYDLELAMPETPEGQGLQLNCIPLFNEPAGKLLTNGEPVEGMTLCRVMVPPLPSIPWALLVPGLLLAAAALAFSGRFRHPAAAAAITGAAIMIIVSQYSWEHRLSFLNSFWVAFWPDGYVGMAHQLYMDFSGTLPWDEVARFFRNHPHGHAWFIPLVLSGMKLAGMRYMNAYALLNVVFTLGGVGLLWSLAHRHRLLGTIRHHILFVLAVGLTFLTFRSAMYLLNDAGGLFFTALFAWSYDRLLAARRAPLPWIILSALAIGLGIQTRLALLPLLFVPLAMTAWSCLTGTRCRKELLAACAPTLLGGAFLLAVLTGLDLLQTILIAQALVLEAVYVQQFTWGNYLNATASGLQLAILMLPLHAARLFRERFDALLICIILGFQIMMFLSTVIPWHRYWIPFGPLASAYAFGILLSSTRWEMPKYILATASILGNLHFALSRVII